MAENSKIQWTDHTASPWHGCSEVHVGCDNCYAAAMALRNPSTLGVWGEGGTRIKSKSFIDNLRKWNRSAAKRGVVESVFPSICDPFEDRPELVEWRNEMFAVADECPNIRLLLLTKRPENVRRMWPWPAFENPVSKQRPNVWLGTSISDQATADKWIPELLKLRDLTPVLFVSAEPLIGAVKLTDLPLPHTLGSTRDALTGGGWMAGSDGGAQLVRSERHVDLVIVGGESGHGARPCNVEWIRSIVKQCAEAGTKCFVKQLGSSPVRDGALRGNDAHMGPGSHREQTPILLSDKKGGDMAEWPADIRVRQMPATEASK